MTTQGNALNWPEYLIETAALGTFMVSAAAFAAVLYHPSSPVSGAISHDFLRRGVMGLAMGATAVAIIYSPWGQRSGAHMNPAVTLTFFRLGRVARRDFAAYVASQFAGGIAGVGVAAFALGAFVADPPVNYVTTLPGPHGEMAAFAAEAAISFVLMLTVLAVSSHPTLAPFTGVCAGLLVWTYITVEAPLSGMSMNPARTFGSALLARNFSGLWIYFTAPPLGMLLAAEVFVRRMGIERILCAKLHHPATGPCIFGCERQAKAGRASGSAAVQGCRSDGALAKPPASRGIERPTGSRTTAPRAQMRGHRQ
jgi:aquaporin Z